MYKRIIITVLFTSLLLSPLLLSQEVMTLQDCLRKGLQNNYDLQITRNEALISEIGRAHV